MTDTTTPETLLSVDHYEFKPNPIKGYPELWWRGKRPFTSTRFYPAQHKETHGKSVEGPDGREWRNKIFWGDNLQVMSHMLKEFRGRVDLIYIDPPFDSKADYKKKIDIKGNKATNDISAFEEKQYTDIWSNDEYLQFIYERLVIMKELLRDGGSIFLHCDWHKVHMIRSILDQVFGPDSFKSHIIRVKSNPKNSDVDNYGNIHDDILFYRKSGGSPVWNSLREEKDSEDLRRLYSQIDAGDRRYTTVALHAPGERFGETGKPWRGIAPPTGRHWAYVHSQLDKFEEEGRIEWSTSGNPRLIRYADEDEGNRVQDIWTMKDPQYSIYPTEKSEMVLERILLSTTNQGDIVFDCFMGSGTTQAVAMKLGRCFIGADINLGAVQTTTKRLLQVADDLSKAQPKLGEEAPTYYTGFEIYNVNNYDVFRNPVQARELLIEALEINKFPAGNLFDGEKDGRLVKIMPVNRIATRADLSDLIAGFDYAEFGRRKLEHPSKAVEKIQLVCMGHEPDLKAQLQKEVGDYKLDIEVVDILRDRQDLQFKRDSEAEIEIEDGHLVIKQFYPLNLMQKLSLQQENVTDWREMVESVMIDWNYDGAIITEPQVDIPDKNGLVRGRYKVPEGASNIRVKITDLLSESLEQDVPNG